MVGAQLIRNVNATRTKEFQAYTEHRAVKDALCSGCSGRLLLRRVLFSTLLTESTLDHKASVLYQFIGLALHSCQLAFLE